MLWCKPALRQVFLVVELAEVSVTAITQHSHNGVPRAQHSGTLDGTHAIHSGRAAHKEAIVAKQVLRHLHRLPVCPLEGIVDLRTLRPVSCYL